MLVTYHNHSTWSDGLAHIDEIIIEAKKLKIEELGISDHFEAGPNGILWQGNIPKNLLNDYVNDVLTYQGKNDGLKIRVGLEVEWSTDYIEEIGEMLQSLPLDFVIGSIHSVKGFSFDDDLETWKTMKLIDINQLYHDYWTSIESMAKSHLFDIVGHIDYIKLYGYYPSIEMGDLINNALDSVAEAGMAIELNTGGWDCPCNDTFPSLQILRQCFKRKIPVILSSDAHSPKDLLRGFDAGMDRLINVGFKKLALFSKRQMFFYKILK